MWKILYDPSRFPEWWVGFETVETEDAAGGDERRYTMYPDGYPDFPMPQVLRTSRDEGHVIVSCLVSDLRFEWRLEPADEGTRITIEVEIPEREAGRLDGQSSHPHSPASVTWRPPPEHTKALALSNSSPISRPPDRPLLDSHWRCGTVVRQCRS